MTPLLTPLVVLATLAAAPAKPGKTAPPPKTPVTTPAPASAPASAPALPRPAGVTFLDNLKAVETLCHQVRLPAAADNGPESDVVKDRLEHAARVDTRRAALERVYAVRLPSDRFRFADYAPDEGRLTLDASAGFHTLQGGLSAWSTDTEGLVFLVSLGTAQEVSRAKEQGRLSLTLYLHLDADPDEADEMDTLKGETCVSRAHSDAYQLAVTFLAGELHDAVSGRLLGRFTTDKGRQTPLVATYSLGEATLRMGAPEGAGNAAGAVLSAMEALRDKFQACYARLGGQAEGGTVLALEVDRTGTVRDVTVAVSSLESEELTACLAHVAKSARPVLKAESPMSVTVPLVWGRPED
jgi:hypothetical protein